MYSVGGRGQLQAAGWSRGMCITGPPTRVDAVGQSALAVSQEGQGYVYDVIVICLRSPRSAGHAEQLFRNIADR